MRFTFLALLFWVTTLATIDVVSALDTNLKGCHLVIPEEVLKRPDPQPETGLLMLHVQFDILKIRDVPNSGGSFGVDLMQV